MNNYLNLFCEIPCLTENTNKLSGIYLQKKWFKFADRRVMGQYFQKFIQYNSSYFDFLGVVPHIIGLDQNIALTFSSSHYIGAIPLRSPDTGKQIGDFVVRPRFTGSNRFEDYIEILDLLGANISPETKDSLPLISGRNFTPPLYLEAIKFISTLELLLQQPWRKFDNVEIISPQISGQVNWNKYINSEFKIEKRIKFPLNKNILSSLHPEYCKIRYVFDICKKELLSSSTSQKIKTNTRPRLLFIEENLYLHQPKATKGLIIKQSDSPVIRACKEQANRILFSNLIDSIAWRVNFSDVFEKFIQYIFCEVAKANGGKVYSNYKLSSYNQNNYSWELKYLEPDAIYQKNNFLIFIDAKYKSNLYNKYSNNQILKEDYRHDLHQIIAYSSFSNTIPRYSFLFYPSTKIETEHIKYKNKINNITNSIIIFGVPLKKESIHEAKICLIKELNEIELNNYE